MVQKVFVNRATKSIRIRPNAESAAGGEVLLGTIDHADEGASDGVGFKGSHVIYQHIEELMNKAGLLDHHLYKINGYRPVTGVNAGPNLTVTADAGANNTKQLSPVVIPDNTSEVKTVTYVSSDPTKATVSADGLVTGVAEGSTVITVTTTSDAKTDTVTVTVTA